MQQHYRSVCNLIRLAHFVLFFTCFVQLTTDLDWLIKLVSIRNSIGVHVAYNTRPVARPLCCFLLLVFFCRKAYPVSQSGSRRLRLPHNGSLNCTHISGCHDNGLFFWDAQRQQQDKTAGWRLTDRLNSGMDIMRMFRCNNDTYCIFFYYFSRPE